MTLCFKAAENIEGKHPFISFMCKTALKLPWYLTTQELAWDKILSINLSWFHIFTFQLPFLVCHRK